MAAIGTAIVAQENAARGAGDALPRLRAAARVVRARAAGDGRTTAGAPAARRGRDAARARGARRRRAPCPPTSASTSARSARTWCSSTTTDRVLARRYLMTAGRPLEAVRQGLREVGEQVGDRVDRARRRRDRLRPLSDRRLHRRRRGAQRDHRAGARRRRDRSRGGHDLRDRRPGQQVHPPAERRGRRLRDEQRLRRGHRLASSRSRPNGSASIIAGEFSAAGLQLGAPRLPRRALHRLHGVGPRAPPAARRARAPT